MRLSLPDVRLDHLYRLTDDTGILQHATYCSPNRNHGYCTDDNARALLVSAMSYRLLNNSEVLPYLERYLSFLLHAWNDELQRFRNFMSYDRRWLDEEGSEDCQGRAIWALGYLTTHPPASQDLSLATDLFHRAAAVTAGFEHFRAQALCILGFSYYLRRYRDAGIIRELMGNLCERIYGRYRKHAGESWCWADEQLTFNNGRVPQALILAGHALERSDWVDCGIDSLRWLLKSHRTPAGHLSLVGNRGWWRQGADKAEFDQQAIDAAALVGACKSAYKVTGAAEWLSHMRRCFEWFLGRNPLGVTLVDFKSRGCCDGLQPDGLNHNQGAESTLSWLLSLLTMYEMHPGQPVEHTPEES